MHYLYVTFKSDQPKLKQKKLSTTMHLTSIARHLTAATPPPSTTIGDANGVIQMVSTALIIILAVIFVTSSIFICFHRSLSDGCCGVNGERDDDFVQFDGGDGRRRRMPGLSRVVIETLPTYMYSDVKAHRLGNGELECAVCLNEFKDVEILRLLPNCCHVFHPDCIDTWLKSRATCPVCRADVGSMSNLTEHGELRMFGFTSEEDHSYDIEQLPAQVITPEPVQMPRFQGNNPRAHSTGHSPAWTAQESDRFTLRLPEEVRNKLAASSRWRHGSVMAFRSSPKSWYRPRNVVGWCSRSNRKENFHRFNTQDRMDRFGEYVASSNVIVSCSGSPKSDGPVDYSTLVNV